MCCCSANKLPPPFALGVRDSFMIAHSFHNHPKFGPAGKLHGATYTCDVEFMSQELVPDTNWVIDIGYVGFLRFERFDFNECVVLCLENGSILANTKIPVLHYIYIYI